MALADLPTQAAIKQDPQDMTIMNNPRGNMGVPPNLNPGGGNPYTTGNIPTVTDPDQAFADMTRQQYLDYVTNYGTFEEDLINQAQTDTSLIDQAREDTATSQAMAKGIADRNISRYGTALTPAQQQEMQRSMSRSNTLGGIQAVSDARLAQRDANQTLLADLINIGQNVNRSSLQQMGSAAADATARQNAHTQAKAAHKAQTYSMLGSLGAAAILAAFI